jgi:hypothetical protein
MNDRSCKTAPVLTHLQRKSGSRPYLQNVHGAECGQRLPFTTTASGPNQTLTMPLGAAMRLLQSGRVYNRATDNLLAFLLRGM